jgi:hypothetical protein
VPVGRVQEIDRRAMLWFARQPGETLADRAGDDQRVLAVAREENFDTLENRVLSECLDRNPKDVPARQPGVRASRRTRRNAADTNSGLIASPDASVASATIAEARPAPAWAGAPCRTPPRAGARASD